MKRITIYSAEIAILLGKSQSSAQKLVKIIKDAYGKKKHQPITIQMFCNYMDLPYDDVYNMVNNISEHKTSKSA